MKRKYNYQFPTPRYLSMPSCALDISDQSIKYGELIAGSHGILIGRYNQEIIPDKVIVSGKIMNPSLLVEILKKIHIKENITFVRVSLPEEQMYLFTLVLPRLPHEQLRETILLQLEEHIPLSATDAVFDYDVMKETETNITVQVAATAATLIESYLSVFEQSNLIPISFELEAEAIARAVVPNDYPLSVMIVDFGQTRTGISIAEAGRVLFSSTFDMGGKDLTAIMAKDFNISFEEAEKMKKTYGRTTTNAEQNNIFQSIINGVSVLRDELNKHYVYWQTHTSEDGQPHAKIEKIILCGGDANLAGIVEYLSVTMKVPVEYANAWVNILDTTTTVPTMPFDDSLSYVTVLGLALGDFETE